MTRTSNEWEDRKGWGRRGSDCQRLVLHRHSTMVCCARAECGREMAGSDAGNEAAGWSREHEREWNGVANTVSWCVAGECAVERTAG
eukprot:3501963-Rhodomonas_salina.1